MNSTTLAGGNGGIGAPALGAYSSMDAGSSAPSGGGGGGGSGALVNGAATLTNTGSITGGVGGIGGYSTDWIFPAGLGGGGGGGVLLDVGSQLTNSGSIAGGRGGATGLGPGGTRNGAGAFGGVGVYAAGSAKIVDSGSITGALNEYGSIQANAVLLTGGGNTLELDNGFSFSGAVGSSSGSTNGGDTLAWGGDVSPSAAFDLSQLGNQYQGFAQFAKVGASTWALSNSTGVAAPWSISAGTLELDGTLPSGSSIDVVGGVLSGVGTLNGNLTVKSGGTVAPGNAGAVTGTLTVSGDVDLSSGALDIAAAAGANSQLLSSGTVQLGGTLALAFSSPPTISQVYTLVSATTISGIFSSANVTGLSSDEGYSLGYGNSSVVVTIGAAPSITSSDNTTFTVTQSGSYVLTTSNASGISLDPADVLPAGVTFVDNGDGTATLSGTPSLGSVASYSLHVSAHSSIVAPDATQTFTLTVQKADQAVLGVLATPAMLVYGGTSTLSSTGGSGTGTVSFQATGSGCSLAGTALSGIDVGPCSITAQKTADANFNAAESVPTDMPVGPATLTITPIANQSKVFGTSDPIFTYTSSGLVGSDTVSGNLSRLSGETVGSYAYAIGTVAASKPSDYSLMLAPGSFAITQAGSTATLSSPCMLTFLGREPFTLNAAVSGVNGATGSVTFDDGANVLCNSVGLSSGSASCTFALSSGPSLVTAHQLNATYNGDTNHQGSTSTALTVTVLSASDVIFRADYEEETATCPIE